MRFAGLVIFVSLTGFPACNGSRSASEDTRALPPATGPVDDEPAALPAPTAARDEPAIPMPGPARGRLSAAVRRNAECEACHHDEAQAWRASYHRRAYVDPAFRSAFAIEPQPFCRSCHAPEADPMKEPPAAVGELGVGCVTCHVTEDGFVLAALRDDDRLGAPDPDPPAEPAAPHPLRRSRAFAHMGGCDGCHEFRFPVASGDGDASFMQTTAREHLRSPAAAKACADCHMPLVEGRRSHAFREVRDEAWLRASLEVTVARGADDTLRVELAQTNAGHAFPTGDLFRRLEVAYDLVGAGGELLRHEARYLARHFELLPGRFGRQLTADDRIEGAPETIALALPPPGGASPGARISWRVTYQRVATVGQGSDPASAVIESQVVLRSGSLPWIPPPTRIP